MTDRSRRTLLRDLAGVTAVGTTTLAGCSALSDGEGSSPAMEWLYDPTRWTDTPQLSIRFEAPSALAAEREHLHPEIREDRKTPLYSMDLDPESTDWVVFQSEGLLDAPTQAVYGGTFDGDTARRNTAVMSGSSPDTSSLHDDGSVGNLQAVSNDGEFRGAYDDETIVSLTGEHSRSVAKDGVDGTKRLSDADEGVASYLDAVGFDHTASVDIWRTPEEGWFGMGTAYRVGGESTTVRFILLEHDWEEEQLRNYVDLDRVTVDTVSPDGPVQWADVVAPTNRLGLNGMLFRTGLPLEESS